MLALSLRRTRGELHVHRSWLNAFVADTRISNAGGLAYGVVGPRQNLWHFRSYVDTTPKHIRKRLTREKIKQREVAEIQAEEIRVVEGLRQAVQNINVAAIVKIFKNIPSYSILDHNTLFSIVQCLHEALRRAKRTEQVERLARIEEIVGFAEQLVNLIEDGHLTPGRRAHLHLLCIFKEAGSWDVGIKFWNWLESQDDSYVSDDVYGAAIELLATSGASLVEMEALYDRALKRFPGTFNAYHLSPNAVLPDRDHSVNISGISMILLQGILTARLMCGDSKNAYMALDTALRLYPTVTPGRIFSLFIYERPLAEAYSVFAIACRAGNPPPFQATRKLLTGFRASSDLSSASQHITVLRQMLSIVYMYAGAGGYITSNLTNEIVIATTQILRLRGISALDAKDKKRIVAVVMETIQTYLKVSARYGANPTISAFNSIITNLAGFGQSKHLIQVVLNDITRSKLQPNHVTLRSILTAAGHIRDEELLVKSWHNLVQSRKSSDEEPDLSDYHVLISAAKLCGAIDFAQIECKRLPKGQQEDLLDRLYSSVQPDSEASSHAIDMSGLLRKVNKFQADLQVFDERTEENVLLHDFSAQCLPLRIVEQPHHIVMPEEDLHALYDEITAAHSQPRSPDQPVPPERSRTNIAFGTLRYENWKMMNYLLALAEKHDHLYNHAVEQAIAKKVAPPSREQVLKAEFSEDQDWQGLSDLQKLRPDRSEKVSGDQVAAARRQILGLRGLLPTAEV